MYSSHFIHRTWQITPCHRCHCWRNISVYFIHGCWMATSESVGSSTSSGLSWLGLFFWVAELLLLTDVMLSVTWYFLCTSLVLQDTVLWYGVRICKHLIEVCDCTLGYRHAASYWFPFFAHMIFTFNNVAATKKLIIANNISTYAQLT